MLKFVTFFRDDLLCLNERRYDCIPLVFLYDLILFYSRNNQISLSVRINIVCPKSTTGSEYSVAGGSCSNLVWVKGMLKEYNVEQDIPTLCWVNLSTIDILKNTMLNSGMLALERKLVKEFLVYISYVYDYPLRKKYQKVFVRGECVNFSPNTINKFLGVEETKIPKLEAIDNQVCKKITANQIKVWPKKIKFFSGKLYVKYAILNKIVAANWVPTTHSSNIATWLGKFVYDVG